VLDVSDPAHIIRVANYETVGNAQAVQRVGDKIYVATADEGLVVLSLDAQPTIRLDATPGIPLTIEATTNVSDAASWMSLFTTNLVATPVDFTDERPSSPRMFYRARQP
jgi:hypothetical protein